MKVKNYEEMTYIYTIIFFIFLLVIILMFYSLNKNIRTFKTINASVVKNDLVEVLVTDKELKTIYSNKYLYVNRRKRRINIEKIDRSVLKRKNIKYHNVLLKVKLNKTVKVNDIKTLILFKEKINVFKMIKIIWKGV